jgi:hypothetical protein
MASKALNQTEGFGSAAFFADSCRNCRSCRSCEGDIPVNVRSTDSFLCDPKPKNKKKNIFEINLSSQLLPDPEFGVRLTAQPNPDPAQLQIRISKILSK